MEGLIVVLFWSFIIGVSGNKPNFLVILTDDQDVLLKGLAPMNNTRKYIANQGATFMNAYTTTPLCCPSRSSILTGLYAHNHGTKNNSISGGCSSENWQKNFEPKTFAAILHSIGYQTFYAGKYLNQYGHAKVGGPQHVPEGWDWWIGLVGNSVYYNYTLSVNGTAYERGDDEDDYLTDVLWGYSCEFLKYAREPFLMVISPPAPHEPFTPAARHQGKYAEYKAPRTPNFGKSDKTKHWLVRQSPNGLSPNDVDEIDRVFQKRLETLLSVDELVESMVLQLRDMDALKNTYVIFLSDNGYHLGQFNMPYDKRQPYETDIKIPLLISGPNVARKIAVTYPVLNIDIAPTILDLAGVGKYSMDGKSIFRTVNTLNGRRSFMVEYFGEGRDAEKEKCNADPNVKPCSKEFECKYLDARNNTYSCIRQIGKERNDLYCWFDDREEFRELYDLKKDPFQLENIAFCMWEKKTKRYEYLIDCCRKSIAAGGDIELCFNS